MELEQLYKNTPSRVSAEGAQWARKRDGSAQRLLPGTSAVASQVSIGSAWPAFLLEQYSTGAGRLEAYSQLTIPVRCNRASENCLSLLLCAATRQVRAVRLFLHSSG